ARLEDTPRRKALEYTPFTRYPFTFICPENHPLRLVKKLALKHFTQHPLILPGQTAYCRQRFDSVMSQANLNDKVHVVIESTFPFLLFEYVRMGMGTALAPLPARIEPSPQHTGVILRDASHL